MPSPAFAVSALLSVQITSPFSLLRLAGYGALSPSRSTVSAKTPSPYSRAQLSARPRQTILCALFSP